MAARKRPRPPGAFAKSKKPRSPLWNPLAGITQTGLDRFMVCPEQFSVNYIDGNSPRKFREPLEFGNLFHLCCEFQGKDTPTAIAKKCCDAYVKSRLANAGDIDRDKLQQMVGVIQLIFPKYAAYYSAKDRVIKWIGREKVFRVPYPFQDYDGKTLTIDLVGKMDGVYRDLTANVPNLKETKTKSNINAEAIRDGLRADFQTLFYLLALRLETKKEPKEVLYDVIKRPGQRWNKTDTMKSYLARIEADINKKPKQYFARWRVTLSSGTIDNFCKMTLDPTLRELFRWWRSIEKRPFDRFASPYHSLKLPALTGGRYGRSEYYELMIRGNRTLYYNRSDVFPELNESIKVVV